ncbi:hypothetical protein Efla_003961 [Eimeria flavescens]
MEPLSQSGPSTAASSSDVEQGGRRRSVAARGRAAAGSSSSSSRGNSCCCLTRLLRLCVHCLSAAWMAAVAAHALSHTFRERGFFCGDPDIALPYKPQTVSSHLLIAISVVFPFCLIACMEALLLGLRLTGETAAGNGKRGGRLGGWRIPEGLVEVYRHLGAFCFSILSCWVLTEVLKNAVGSLRPHFLSVCQPDWGQLICRRGEEQVYVSRYRCLGDEARVAEARRSFPSGHSSFTFCGMLFAALYLQGRFKWQQQRTAPHPHPPYNPQQQQEQQQQRQRWRRALMEKLFWTVEAATPFLQVLLLLLAFFVAATRVVDHYHHVRDVVAGGCIGALTAMHAAFFVIDLRGKMPAAAPAAGEAAAAAVAAAAAAAVQQQQQRLPSTSMRVSL